MNKNNSLFHFIGAADELNSHLGLVKALLPDTEVRQFIEKIQKNLMVIMAHASDPKNDKYFFTEDEMTVLKSEIKKIEAKIPKQDKFVIPGKNTAEAQIHIARTVARRAERFFFAVNDSQVLCPKAGEYLNRLSDYLFVLALEQG